MLVTIALATALIGGACGDPAGPEAGTVAALALEAGLPTSGITGEPLPVPPVVVARDARGRPVPGVEVRFEVQSGGGTVQAATVVTGSDGVARAREWRLGPVLGEQVLAATASTPGGEERRVVMRVQAAWRWTELPPPMDDRELSGFRIHPADDQRWYALHFPHGVSVSTDAGATWTRTLWESEVNQEGFQVDPVHTDTIFAAYRNRLVVSGDRGATWTERAVFEVDLWIRSVAVLRDGTLLVGPQWPEGRTPGVFRSEDRGLTWTHHPYGAADGQRLLTWVLREDPSTGIVWSGNEIADHPEPYRPPFLFSADGGRTWTDATARLPFSSRTWHVIDVAVAGDHLYALSEGSGVFRSRDGGASWQSLGVPFALSLMTHGSLPGAVFGGDFGAPFGEGEVMVSFDQGDTFRTVRRLLHNVSALALTGDGRRLVVSTWGGGLRVAELPEDPQ